MCAGINRHEAGRKSPSSYLISQGFDSVAEGSECADHSRSAGTPGLFGHRGAAFLIANAIMQNYPDQLTETMSDGSDGFVVS